MSIKFKVWIYFVMLLMASIVMSLVFSEKIIRDNLMDVVEASNPVSILGEFINLDYVLANITIDDINSYSSFGDKLLEENVVLIVTSGEEILYHHLSYPLKSIKRILARVDSQIELPAIILEHEGMKFYFLLERLDMFYERARLISGTYIYVFLITLFSLGSVFMIKLSKSLIKPILVLSKATRKISQGDLNFELERNNIGEIGTLYDDFITMRDALAKSSETTRKYEIARQEMIANISHDLKTPITSIIGYITGIKDGVANTPEKIKKYLDTILSNAKDVNALAENLALFSKLETESNTLNAIRFDVNEFLMDSVDDLSFELSNEGIDIVYKGTPNQVIIKADMDQIKRVIMNAVNNSRVHVPKSFGRIEVMLEDIGNLARISIKDNGSGVPKNKLSQIFERFYKSDSSRTKIKSHEGSGLGLSICKKIVESHGGFIWAESVYGKSFTLIFTLRKDDVFENTDCRG